ncbi:hypothetical protein JTE90_021536 [Oedothorax gibbosus]|uniref:Poly [ADP-ribose] polymerase n=1 Tax=Oedothorax gibbosus TaxID=931172 RepID=A0AAV6VN81_9ARAC|nr:hypothetical protein JTE90_021536 [Oedothorax gibbosus]
MANGNDSWDFLWQFEQRKKWVTYSDAELMLLNEAIKENKESLLLPSKSTRKKIAVDFENMVQRNQVTSYEQRVRCVAFNSEFFVWLWKDEFDDWHCYKPFLSISLEVAYHQKENTMKYFDSNNYEVNLETFEQVNEDNKSTNMVKRETIDLPITAELKKICRQNEKALKQACLGGATKAKRIRLDSSVADNSVKINLLPTAFNPLDIDESKNLQAKPSLSNVPVDSECPERENFHIFCEGTDIYSAMLNQTNLQNNNNKFYLIQLLENNHKKQFAVWRRWGRVGNRGQSDYSNYGNSLAEAKASFDDKFYAKTKNHWSDRDSFVHYKGKYDLLHMDLIPETKTLVKETKTGIKSKLGSELQSLLELICDQKRMEEMMKEMSFDSNRTPLGKLTLKQVKDGYIALNKIAVILSRGGKGSELVNACNDFYTKIPHSFGMKTPPIITANEIEDKVKMLEALANITVAMGVLNSTSNMEEHPLDKYYRSLDCQLESVCPTCAEYLEIDKCLRETHGPTHANYTIEIVDVFKSCKAQESETFIESENKLLLWHGSRVMNWLGILKQGLRIAPPEAPVSGYMFGKGIYFADVCSKSANYCCATKNKNEGILLICEVSVGNQYELTASKGDLPVGLPSNYNSVKGKGRISPSEFKVGSLSSEAKLPYGPLSEDSSYAGYLIYNEYIVYNVNQVKMKYLVRVKFNFK